LQDRVISIERLRHVKGFSDAKNTSQNRICKSVIERN